MVTADDQRAVMFRATVVLDEMPGIHAALRSHPVPGMAALLTLGAPGWRQGSWAWARLDDGRLSALYLPEKHRLAEEDLTAWIDQIRDDLGGDRLQVYLPHQENPVPVLHAAAVCPLDAGSGLNDLPVGAFGLAPDWPSDVRVALLAFQAGLDADIRAALLRP